MQGEIKSEKDMFMSVGGSIYSPYYSGLLAN